MSWRSIQWPREPTQDGIAIIYISHRMNEVYQLSDRVSVLRDGEYVGTLERDEISPDKIVRMMVGRELSSFYKKAHETPRGREPVIFSARDLSDGKRVRGCSFDVHRGEVLGLAGLVGAGRTELARLIYGADQRASGTIEVNGQKKEIRSPIDAIRAGILYLTEDRKRLGLFLEMSVLENINVGVIDRDARLGGFLNRGTGRRRATQSVKNLSIRTPTINAAVGALSGGNQQKALLARLLELEPRVLFLDEPTRGIDIGAKSDIYRVNDKMAKENIAVVVISSELPELVGICDRVLVMREGKIAGEVGNASGMIPLTQENIIAFATATHSLSSALTGGRFMSWQNLSIVAAQASINTVLAAGMTFVILTGGIDLSVGSILAASAMLGLIVSLVPAYSFLGCAACLATGLVLGLLNGTLIALLRLHPSLSR